MTSFETEGIPDFLVSRISELEEKPLRSVAEYARDPLGKPPEDVPENIANPLYMQSEEVCAAVAEYAEGLAEEDEEGEGDGGEGDQDEDDDPDYMMGPAFG